MIGIALDFQIFAIQRAGGIARYFVEMARALASRDDVRVTCIAPIHVNDYLVDRVPFRVFGYKVSEKLLGTRARIGVDYALSLAYLAALKPQILHETFYLRFGLKALRARRVITIHDMIPEKFGHQLVFGRDQFVRRKAAAIRRADHIICVSANTKRDLVELYPMVEERVSVVRHGFTVARPSGELPGGVRPPYLLYVGARGGYKKFDTLAEAVAGSPLQKSGVQIVCYGGGPFQPPERARLAELGFQGNQVVQVEGDDTTLATAYARAAAFVYPSLYEGFGLPLLEAMASECPVVTTRGGSIPEVAGDAAAYFESGSPDALAATLEMLLGDSHSRLALVEAGRRRCNLFSWERCAEGTLAAYRAALSR